MNWKLYAVAALVFTVGAVPAFAQTPQQFTVKDAASGKSFQVNYGMTSGIINDIAISPQDTSLIISLNAPSDGNLTMILPRELVDAKDGANDDQFFVLVDGADTDFVESKTTTDRTITVFVPEDTTQVEVIGTQVVPEFGLLASGMLVAGILGVLIMSARTRLKFV